MQAIKKKSEMLNILVVKQNLNGLRNTKTEHGQSETFEAGSAK
jgi:hypothetical protein